jgi:hypothetical protein
MLSLITVALPYKKGWQIKRFDPINFNPNFELYRRKYNTCQTTFPVTNFMKNRD